ncbi:hypothetical protein QZH41_014269, partial [Actinostola sp. cb2023]
VLWFSAVKRLMREAKELHQPTELYYAQPLEDNLFEWHFTVRGPPDTAFEGGRYHGRITLPPEYPMKPPSIMLLTPNGRFETGKKICLSMSAHHPETWQPSWSIRTVLMAIIGFMPSKGAGAIGALDYSPKERSILARKSMEWKCSVCASCNRNSLLDEGSDSCKTKEAEQEIAEITGQIAFKGEDVKVKKEQEIKTETPQSNTSTESSPTIIDGGNYPAYPGMTMGNPWMQSYQQQYMAAYNPYYMHMFSNPSGGYGGVQPYDAGTINQSNSTNQSVDSTTNPAAAVSQTVANQNSSNNNQSNVRQRITAGQRDGQTEVPRPVHGGRGSNAGMISLVIMWFVVVSSIAFVLRRIFIA